MGDNAETAAVGQAEVHRGQLAGEDAALASGDTVAASTTPTEARPEEVMVDPRADDFEFNIAVDVIYHRDRAAWLTWAHRILLLGAIIFGSVAATDLSNPKVCAILAAVCAALDIVFDPIGTAALHRDCLRALHRVILKLRKARFTTEAVDIADEEMMELSVIEPAPYNILRLLAYEEATVSLGRQKPVRTAPYLLRPLANVFRFEGW